MNLYGQLDLTKAGIIAREHPELVKHIKFKDGEHLLLNVSLFSLQNPDDYGNTETLKVRCKKDEQRKGVNYYLGNFKNGEKNEQQPQPAQPTQPVAEEQDYYPTDPHDLPF